LQRVNVLLRVAILLALGLRRLVLWGRLRTWTGAVLTLTGHRGARGKNVRLFSQGLLMLMEQDIES
jgi:hypothetical protein